MNIGKIEKEITELKHAIKIVSGLVSAHTTLAGVQVRYRRAWTNWPLLGCQRMGGRESHRVSTARTIEK